MMRYFVLALLGGFVLSLSSVASALTRYDVPNITCNGCSYEEMKAKARSKKNTPDFRMAPLEGYQTTVNVFNFDAGVVVAFEVTWAEHFKPPRHTEMMLVLRQFVETSVDYEVEEAFFQIYTLKQDVMSATYEVPETIAGSAWDLPAAGYLQNQVADYIIEDMSWFERFSAAASALLVVFQNDKVEIGEVQVTAVFADGSEAYFKFDGYDHNSDPIFTFANGKDLDGNFISEAAARYMSGSYDFSLGGLQARDRFINAGHRVGVFLQMQPEGSVSLGPLILCRDYYDELKRKVVRGVGCR